MRQVDNRRAALWLLASASLFTFTGVLVKWLGQTLHPFEISFFRALVALLVILPIFARSGGLRAGIKTEIPLLQLFRGVVGSVAMFLGFYAIVALPLAEAQAISFRAICFWCRWPLLSFPRLSASAVRSPPPSVFSASSSCCVPAWAKTAWGLVLSIGALAALGHAFLVALGDGAGQYRFAL